MQSYKDITNVNAQLGNNKIGMNITYVTPLHQTAFVHNVPGYGTTNSLNHKVSSIGIS